ncbi:MAG: PASTA domain-containing protein [Bacteroidetes bacterium]|nr:PASTA domain-containing protein [Bacteroidota bacterium]
MNSFVKQRLLTYLKYAVITGGIIACFAVLFNGILMPFYVNQKDIVAVPVVLGLTREVAEQNLLSLDLQPIISISNYDPKQKPNTVISQNPEGSLSVKVGRRVYLTITASEPAKVAVPELTSKSEREATILIEKAKLKKGGVIYSQSDNIPENVVISQSVSAGKEIKEGSYITLVISRGSARDFVQVPDLTNQSLNEGQNLLLKANLTLGIISFQYTDDMLPNTIVDQYPKSGGQISSGKPVDVWVTKKGKPEPKKESSGRD